MSRGGGMVFLTFFINIYMALVNGKEFSEYTDKEVEDMIADKVLLVENGLMYKCSLGNEIPYIALKTREGVLVDISVFDCNAGHRGTIPSEMITPICSIKLNAVLNGGKTIKKEDIPATYCEVQSLVEESPKESIKH